MKIKRILIGVVTFLLFVTFFIGTDPSTKFFQNLSWGAQLILTLGIFIIASVGFWMIEIAYDFFIDPIYGKAGFLVDKAKEDAKGAGLALIARSINILAAAIIVAASILALNIG